MLFSELEYVGTVAEELFEFVQLFAAFNDDVGGPEQLRLSTPPDSGTFFLGVFLFFSSFRWR